MVYQRYLQELSVLRGRCEGHGQSGFHRITLNGSLVKPRKNLQDLEKMVEETEEEWHRSKVSSPGALLQFIRIVGRSVKGACRQLGGSIINRLSI